MHFYAMEFVYTNVIHAFCMKILSAVNTYILRETGAEYNDFEKADT